MFQQEWFEKAIEEGSEVLVYFIIDQIGAFTFGMRHELTHGRIPESQSEGVYADILAAKEQQKSAVKMLTRFGVQNPTGENDAPTAEYWKWYHWWNNYIHSLSDEDFEALNAALENGLDVSQWRPQGDWKSEANVEPEG